MPYKYILMFTINKSITEEYVFNKDMTVGGYPVSKLIDEYNETNKILGGGDVLNTNFVNYKRFENLILPVGLTSFSTTEYPIQIGGYQTSQTSKSNSTIQGSIDPTVHNEFIKEITKERYGNRKTLNKIIKTSSRKTGRKKQ